MGGLERYWSPASPAASVALVGYGDRFDDSEVT
jgi:hypothetical protein